MDQGKGDYWAFIEKIHDLTEYVQELLRQNGRLKRRVEELEHERDHRTAIASAHQERLPREDPAPVPAPTAARTRGGAGAENGVWRPGLRLTHPGVRTC